MKTFKQFVESIMIHDANGKMQKIKNVKFRGIDGKIHSAPPGKSRSSER
jgi:hypothetical protein